jgi:hypothetical protein
MHEFISLERRNGTEFLTSSEKRVMYTQAENSITQTRNYQKHPNLILGLVSFVVFILAIGLRANRHNEVGDVLLIAAFIMGAVHWAWAVMEYRTDKLSENRNLIWVILVCAVPPVGGIVYYAFNKNLRM